MKSRLSGNHPSDEELAAYIDRGLVNAEADRIAEHLVSCERCYEIYSETVRLQLDGDVLLFSSAEEQRGRAARRRAVTSLWLPFAALLLLSVGSGGYLTYVQLLARPELTTSPAAPPLASLPPMAPDKSPLWIGPTFRGEGGEEETKINEASFRTGVQLVNLDATLQAGQARESQDVIARILGLFKPQPLTSNLYNRYAKMSGDLYKTPPAELLPQAARLARESREVFEPTSFDLGQIVEAGRLAAMARNPTFFQQPETRKFLRRLRWNDKLGLHDVQLDSTTRESLTRVSQIAANRNLRPSDYAELEQQLRKILEVYYPQ
ncbi:MAG: zf-HC2 domain-containing protein [Thermoanaerobaculia bacterium]